MLGLVSAVALNLMSSTHASAEPSVGPPDAVRYYVVGPATADQREYLFQIAARTLGDGNRAQEIFDLNEGRAQPGGGRLTDPAQLLQPGWILLLPSDAHGDGVFIGSPPAADTPKSQSDGATRGRGAGSSNALLFGWFFLVSTVVLVAVLRRSVVARMRPGADGASPQQDRRRHTAGTARPPQPTTADRQPLPAGRSSVEPASPVPLMQDHPVPAGDRPQLDSGRVVTELEPLDDSAPVRLHLRLLGARGGTAASAYSWLGDEAAPLAAIPLVLGRRGIWRFVVDLAFTPDVFTITGALPSSRWFALDLARQAVAAGLTVTVVGAALDLGDDVESRLVEQFPRPGSRAEALASPGLVISGPLDGEELTAARGLVTRTAGTVVPVLVGGALRSSWSISVEPSTARAAGLRSDTRSFG
ncbi:hypothetical protein GCM10022255_108770 [Dactylosporangium darangshiense]|uniref:SPOR domain-containing protein n=1 Tax=Dactylosporangium darangshiense TaxID=579108 RepID=A0ABP8DUD9_9ACTN